MSESKKKNGIKKNTAAELEITAVSNLGYGVGRTDDGVVVFVPGAVTGDRVRTLIIKVTKSYCVGKLTEILKSSDLRDTTDPCRAPATCGGCAYRAVKYGHELELKYANVRAEFDKAGLPDAEILPVLCVKDKNGTPVTWRYRNKGQYRFAKTKNGIRAGFYASGTHRVAGDENCPLQPEIFGQIARFTCKFAEIHGITVYDEADGKGILRHLYLRSGAGENGEIGVCLVINGKTMPEADEYAAEIMKMFPRIVSVTLNINLMSSNVILGDEYVTVAGKDGITDVFCGKKLEVSPAAFYQVNHDAAELLCRTAAGMAQLSGGERLLDLYCGIGTVGLSMAEKVSELVGVEIVPQAVECAVRNAEVNRVGNARFICADSADGAAALLSDPHYAPDVIVLDPPRQGCAEELLHTLTACRAKKIVYISCNPATLARDCAILAADGWRMSPVQPVDLFPRTGHVESVVLLSKSDK